MRMQVNRDYGALNSETTGNTFNVFKKGQVYQATHGGDDKRLPYMYRSFISFSFSDPGGPLKHIEDFNLIATISGSRWERQGYSSFKDLTTEYDNLDGQYYWNTHYTTNTLTFQLSTDGMDQKNLDDFLNWFSAGTIRELILSEHPNRAQLARVSDAPQLSLLPFESQITMKIAGTEYPVTTTLYKGEIILKLILEEPHWYAIKDIMGIERNSQFIDYYYDINKENNVYIFESKDALKILYEDGIPIGSMIDDNMLLGNRAFANVKDNIASYIWSIANDADIEWINNEPSGEGARIEADNTTAPYTYGVIAGAIVDATGSGIISLSPNTYDDPTSANTGHFFYSGTAPSPTVLNFTFTPMIDTYVTTPANSFTSPNTPYSTITVGSTTIQRLQFTTPNILTSYNTVIKIFNADCNAVETYENIRKHIREQVHHQAVRQWAVRIIDYFEGQAETDENAILTNENKQSIATKMKEFMSYFLKDKPDPNDENDVPETYAIKCEFNSETGGAFGWFHYRTLQDINTSPADNEDWKSYGKESGLIKEDIGDMIRSNYLIIKDRNYFTENGHVVKWENSHPEYSHYIYHNFNVPLTEISILYKNMYL